MKPADFIVRIPEPCHEDWNQMQPDAKGKFCSSCSKPVFDFTGKTDLEIKTILIEHKDQKVCGHFKKTQIDRPLSITLDTGNLPKNISITKTFAIALFLVFGSLLFSCKDEKGNELPMERGLSEMVIGDIAAPPALTDSSSCEMITGEAPMDSTVVVEMPGVVNGALSVEPLYFVEPPVSVDPPPVHYLGGAVMYGVFVPDSVADTSTADSTRESKRLATDQLTINPDKVFIIYPNPTAGECTLAYDLLKRSDVTIAIYDMNGALVRSVSEVKGQYEGRYRIPVSLHDLSNGIYIVSLINGDKQSTERLVIAR